jgi:tetratricopeptide (TPR) repeat protein
MTQEPSSRVPAAIAELITTHRLGRFRTRYTPRMVPRGLFWSIVFTLLGLIFFIGSFFVLRTGSFFPSILLGLVLLSIGLIPPIFHFLNCSWQVYLCKEGLISTRKGRTDIIRWDEVTAVLVGSGVSYTLRRADGKELRFDDTLRDVKDLGEIIVRETRRYLFPQAPSSSDVESKPTSSREGGNQEASNPFSRANDLRSSLAHLGVVLDSGESDPKTALWGGLAKASLALAWDEYTAGKFDKVITDMTELINDANLQDKPRFVSVLGAAYYVRGLAYEKQGNLIQASQDFESSGRLVPEYEPAKQAWVRVGELYRHTRHLWLESTLAQLGVVLELSKSDSDALVGIMAKTDLAFAWKEYSEGKFVDKAIVSATRLINDANLQNNARFVSVRGTAYYIRGLAYEKQGNTAQAILDFQSALRLVPEYELAKQALEQVTEDK